jgi:hypothetical protein
VRGRQIISPIALTLLAAAALLLRNNALYALVLAAVITLIFLRGRERRTYLLIVLAAVCISAAGKQVMMAQTNAEETPTVESLSVPLQQMARVAKYVDCEPVSAYISEEASERYSEVISDPVKWTIEETQLADMGAFLQTWVRTGLQYPKIYLDAFLANTAGYWYIDDTYITTLYYLQTQNINPGDGTCDVILQSKCTWLYDRLDRLFGSRNGYQDNLILSCLCSMALYTWILVFYLLYMIAHRRYRMLLAALFPAAYVLTLLLGPCALVRYLYLVILMTPVLIGAMLSRE